MRGNEANRICIEKMITRCDEIVQMYEGHHKSRKEFDESIEFQYACGMCIVQIGELVSRMDEGFTSRYEDIPWKQMKGLRNIYAHDYERIDNDMIWETITEDIPSIREKLERVSACFDDPK